MEKQLIITIGRQYGSRGHQIGEKLAEKMGIELYDRNLLDEVAVANGANREELSKYDEKPKKPFFSRTVRGMSNSPAEAVAELQFALLKSKAADGDSFVLIGRCGDQIFKGLANYVSIFITADYEDKVERIMTHRNFSRKEAEKAIARHDKNRATYHDHFCKTKWNESGTYDLVINMSKTGIDGAVELIYNYVTNILK